MLTARASGRDLGVTVWKFPCGEVGVRAERVHAGVLTGEHVWVTLNWEDSTEVMALAQLVDILKAAGAKSWSLVIPYFPYSRQDRRCAPGEAHALKVFATILNSLGFSCVRTYDAHSCVLEALVENLNVIPQEECAYNLPVFDVLVAPDAGAEKKIYNHHQVNSLAAYDRPSVLCASKTRDENGKITSTYLRANSVAGIDGKRVCVVDDLCDGGATFLAVGAAVREHKPKELSLYVTHGMFTKGYDALFQVFDNIYVHHRWIRAPELDSCYNARFHLI